MSNFLNKIPVSPITSFGNPSVPNGSTFGTNFSILQTGGYMEVYTLSGLTYTIPPVTTGIIEFSGNSIPIQLSKGSGSVFSPDVLTLNSDNISSGRRKLGMLAYVYETNKIYQFRIDNYDTLWNNATGATGPGGPTVVISDFGTTVKNNSPEGQLFIDAWTASTISGVGGYNDTNASWRVLSTGGSSSGGTSITGGTFDNNTDTLTLNNSTGGTVTITGFTDYYTTGFTFNPTTYDLTIQRNDGLPNLSVNLSILSSDVTITGGTYNSSNGTATFTNNTGGTFNVTGFLTGFTDIYVTGGTFNNNNRTLTLTRTDNVNIDITGFTDVFVTGGTYSNGTTTFTNNTGGTFNVSGLTTPFTGGTVTGATNFTGGLTANTFSASTYLGLPIDIRVTGATKSGSVATFTNNTGGTFTLTGLTDVFVTGGTHSLTGGTTTFRNNTGGTFNVSGYFTPSNDIYVTGGVVGNGPSTTDNTLKLVRNNAGNVTIDKLVDISVTTKSQMDTLISNKEVIQGKTYKIYGCDTSLYYNGKDGKDNDVYTTIYLMGLENDKLTETGVGVFYTPEYVSYSIFTNGQNYLAGDKVIWGGFVWTCEIEGTYNSLDIFTLESPYFVINLPFKDGVLESDKYNIRYDDIIYDYENDKIIYRNENDTNIVQTTVQNIEYWTSTMSLYNPIKAFQWGNVYNGTTGIGNQRIINSYNENINYKGLYQTNFYFNNLSYQTDVFVDSENSYQTNFHFENKSYQSNSNIEKASYQDSLYFTTNSYQTTVNIDNGSHQKNITLNNGSYQDSLLLNKSGSYQNNLNFTNGSYQNIIRFDDNAYQTGFTFNNGSYQYNVNFYNTKAVPSQQFFNFNNGSYQSNFDNYDTVQSYFEFDNGSYQTNVFIERPQTNFIFDNGSQYNNNTGSVTQENVTIKGFNRDISGLSSSENGVYFIHDLPTDNTASVYIGKINNQLVQVTKPTDIFVTGGTYSSGTGIITFKNNSGTTFNVTGITTSSTFTGGTVTGATSFTNGLTANTISATTYQNLPVSGVTGGTGISANTTNGLVTIVNTAPDQVVTITGGTNININGTYPNFGINFTGSTGASGDFLPLSGGTVTGATNFTNGLTANTIFATQYLNLPQDIFVTGGTYTSGNAIFTNNSGGTFTVTGFAVGGGGGQTFYLNLSQSQGGNRLLSTTASTASEQTSGVTISNGVTSTIASFQSQPLNITLLPGGVWGFYLHSYKENSNASFNIFVELYKITSGGTQTLLFTTDPAPVTTNSPNPSMQLSDGYFSGTPLSVSDSIVAVVRATNTGNQSHIITLVTEGSQHYSYAVSSLPTQQGLTCDTLSGCSIIQTIQTDVSNKLDKSGGTITGNLIINSGLTATTISATTYSNLPISSSATTGVLSSTDWSTFNGKQDRVSGVSDTEISYLDGVTSSIQTQIDNLVELNFLRQNVGYIIPAGLVNIQPSFNVSPNLSSWALVTSGATATGGIGGFVRFDTTATAGTLAFRRGSFGIILGGYQFEYTQKVRFQTNLTGQRGLWGLSAGYSFATPTNVEPNTNINVVGVCQLSTSTNLHIIHNDGAGTATTVDLGVNYPCNTSIYTYYIRIKRTTSNYTITVERITNTDNSTISTIYTTSTDIPAIGVGSFSPINYITNNAQASIASYFDGGCIAKVTHQ